MRPALLCCALLFATCFSPESSLQAQLQVATIHVRVLRGRKDRAVRKAAVLTTVVPIQPYASPILRTTDLSGKVSLLVQKDAEVRARVLQYPTCGHVPRAQRKQPPTAYAVEQILTSGVVSESGCSRRAVAPTPGELTLLVRPLHWWERLSY